MQTNRAATVSIDVQLIKRFRKIAASGLEIRHAEAVQGLQRKEQMGRL